MERLTGDALCSYAVVMTARISQADLMAQVRAVVAQQAFESITVLPTGCWHHPTGRVCALGGTYRIRRLLWEHHHGMDLPATSNLIATCGTQACQNPDHLWPVARADLGHWLGRPGGAWRPPLVA